MSVWGGDGRSMLVARGWSISRSLGLNLTSPGAGACLDLNRYVGHGVYQFDAHLSNWEVL